jgi:SAM-dependent methyltransferase
MDYAEYYDQQAEATGWHGPAVVFGLMYPYIQSGQSLLDVGIGTGLGSELFHRAGLCVFGMDNSSAMLEATRAKGFATDLRDHDMGATPYPYGRGSFDHAICMGVLQFFEDLAPVFGEVGRVVRGGGTFGFIVVDRKPDEAALFTAGREHTKSDREVSMYRHDRPAVADALAAGGFVTVTDLDFLAFMDEERKHPMSMRAYVARRQADA